MESEPKENRFKVSKEYLLSHHPNCPPYSEHTFKLGKKKFCIGCFIGYPAGIIGIILGDIYLKRDLDNSKPIFFSSVVLCLFFFLSFTHLTEKKPIKMLQKFAVGLGGGLFLPWIYHYPDDRGLNLVTTISTALAIIGLMNVIHIKHDGKICEKCFYVSERPNCPGYQTEQEIKTEQEHKIEQENNTE